MDKEKTFVEKEKRFCVGGCFYKFNDSGTAIVCCVCGRVKAIRNQDSKLEVLY